MKIQPRGMSLFRSIKEKNYFVDIEELIVQEELKGLFTFPHPDADPAPQF